MKTRPGESVGTSGCLPKSNPPRRHAARLESLRHSVSHVDRIFARCDEHPRNNLCGGGRPFFRPLRMVRVIPPDTEEGRRRSR